MRIKILLFIIFLVFQKTFAFSENPEIGSPDWLIEKFFYSSNMPNLSNYYTGEMLSHYKDEKTMGEFIDSTVTKFSYRVLETSKNRIIYAILYETKGIKEDWYCYLNNISNNWKISAIRKLALPGFFFSLIKQLENNSNLSEIESYTLDNMKLITKSDDEIKEYFKSNQSLFSDLVTLLNDEKIKSRISRNESKMLLKVSLISKEKISLKLEDTFIKLKLNTLEAKENLIDFNFGGIMDNSIGIYYIKNEQDVPKMSPSEYIYIEKIAPNWYIYKTT